MVDDGDERDEVVDVLPAELDASGLTGAYEFPNNSRRRLAAVLYVGVAAVCILLGTLVSSPLVNDGFTVFGIGLLAFALYSAAVAVPTRVDEREALVAAAATAGFAAGPASAQMTWRGWRSRPAWRVLLYSAEPQPVHRAVVVVDGVDGRVLEHLVETNPEDWSSL